MLLGPAVHFLRVRQTAFFALTVTENGGLKGGGNELLKLLNFDVTFVRISIFNEVLVNFDTFCFFADLDKGSDENAFLAKLYGVVGSIHVDECFLFAKLVVFVAQYVVHKGFF